MEEYNASAQDTCQDWEASPAIGLLTRGRATAPAAALQDAGALVQTATPRLVRHRSRTMTDSATSDQLLRRATPLSRNRGKLEEVDQEKVKLEVDPPLLPVTVGFSHLYACRADR